MTAAAIYKALIHLPWARRRTGLTRAAGAATTAPAAPAPTLAGVARVDLLREGWERVRTRSGFAGPDGETVPMFARSAERSLAVMSRLLLSGEYRPSRPRSIEIPKSAGGARTLSVFNVRDRILLQAVRLGLQPAIEARSAACSFAYRPGLCSIDAVRALQRVLTQSTWYARADVAAFFDHVRIDVLSEQIQRSVHDSELLCLIDLLLKAGSVDGARGLAQGSAISPLLSNLYLSDFDAAMLADGQGLVRFGDDMVIGASNRSDARAAVERIGHLLDAIGLQLNRTKTVVAPVSAGLRYLGTTFGPDGRVVGETVDPTYQAASAPDQPSQSGGRERDRWTGAVGKLVGQCTVLQGIEQVAARTHHLRHEQRLIVLFTAGRLGDEGARYLHRVMSQCSDYRRTLCDRRLAELDREHRPITCAKIREWLAVANEQEMCACGRTCRSPLSAIRSDSDCDPVEHRMTARAEWQAVVADIFGEPREDQE